MKKLIFNQMYHRFCRMRSIWILYGVYLIMVFPRTYQFHKNIDANSVLYQDDATLFLILALFLLVAQSFKLYVDYKRGNNRWSILTNKKQAFIIGDVYVIVVSILLLYVIYIICLWYQIDMKLVALDKVNAFVNLAKPSIASIIQQTEITNLLIPMKLSANVMNIVLLLMTVENFVCLALIAVKKRIRLLEIACFILSMLILYYMFYIPNYITIVLCILVIIGCFKICMTLWREVSTC